MAKEQRRGNREVKKPKQEKSPSAPTTTTSAPWLTVDKLKAQDRKKK